MIKALLFIGLVVLVIIGGAMVLLDTAKKPRIPDNIKTPEEIDAEDKKWRD